MFQMVPLPNCETLSDHLNVAWELVAEDILIELKGALGKKVKCMSVL